MKFDFKTIVIIALLLLIVGGILLWPSKHDSSKVIIARDSIQRITEANQILAMNARTLETRLVETQVKSRSDSTRFYREITVKNQQLARKRVQIDTVFKDSPVLQSYLQTADSVFSMLHGRIDTLEAQAVFKDGLYRGLIYIKNKEVLNLNLIITQKDFIIKDLEKQARKKRRGAKLWKAAAVVLGISGILVGSQL